MRASRRSTRDRSAATSPRASPSASRACPYRSVRFRNSVSSSRNGESSRSGSRDPPLPLGPFGSTGAWGLTRLSAWWVKLGIRVEFIEPGQPGQNAAHDWWFLLTAWDLPARDLAIARGVEVAAAAAFAAAVAGGFACAAGQAPPAATSGD